MRRIILFLAIAAIFSSSPSFAFRPKVRHIDYNAIYAPALEKANKGDAMSQYAIGMRYERGFGIAQSFKTANDWFLKAAAQNYSMAELKLGDHYKYGRGVPVNLAEAAKWYRKAADMNNYAAQYALGHLYLSGDGVKQDFAEAYFWLSLAATDKQYATDRDRAANLLKPEQIAEVKTRADKWRQQKQKRQ